MLTQPGLKATLDGTGIPFVARRRENTLANGVGSGYAISDGITELACTVTLTEVQPAPVARGYPADKLLAELHGLTRI
jgi:hypothetical protein